MVCQKLALSPGPQTSDFVLGDASLQGVGTLSVHAEIGLVFQNASLSK